MSRYRTPWRAASTLSVLMPVYNERDTVDTIVDMVHAAPIAPMRIELIVVDDCSTDGTRDVLQQLHASGKIHKLHLQPENRGKGAAIKQAMGMSTGDIVVGRTRTWKHPADWRCCSRPSSTDAPMPLLARGFSAAAPRPVLLHSVGNKLRRCSAKAQNLTSPNGDVLQSHAWETRERFSQSAQRPIRIRARDHRASRRAQARIFEGPISYSGRTYAKGRRSAGATAWRVLAHLKYNLGP